MKVDALLLLLLLLLLLPLLLLLLLLPMSTMRLRTLQANHAEMEHPHDTR